MSVPFEPDPVRGVLVEFSTKASIKSDGRKGEVCIIQCKGKVREETNEKEEGGCAVARCSVTESTLVSYGSWSTDQRRCKRPCEAKRSLTIKPFLRPGFKPFGATGSYA